MENQKEVIPLTYQSTADFENVKGEILSFVELNDAYAYINKEAKPITPFKYFNAGFYDRQLGLAIVTDINTGNRGVINTKGIEVVPCEYDEIMLYSQCIEVKRNHDYGLLDMDYNILVPLNKYEDIGIPSEGLISVWQNNKVGYIDIHGNQVIPCIYDRGWGFFEGLAVVAIGSKHGFIDKEENLIIPYLYNDADNFHEGLAPVSLDHKWGFINKQGEEVIPPIYFSVSEFENGFALARMENFYEDPDAELLLINRQGEEYVLREHFNQVGGETLYYTKYKETYVFMIDGFFRGTREEFIKYLLHDFNKENKYIQESSISDDEYIQQSISFANSLD